MKGVHPTAVVVDGAELGAGVELGPYSVIGEHVKVGKGSRVMAHVVLEGRTTIGQGCTIFPFACVGTQTQDLKYKGATSFVEIGDETTLREYVTVNSGTEEGQVTKVGSSCHVMAYSHIAHGCSVGNHVIMANCATLAGDVVLEDNSILGGLSAVHQFARVGYLCIVGGATRVAKDCPPFMMVVGNPAKVRGINAVGLKRAGVSMESQRLLKRAYKMLYRENLSTSQALDGMRKELEMTDEIRRLVSFVEESRRGIVKR